MWVELAALIDQRVRVWLVVCLSVCDELVTSEMGGNRPLHTSVQESRQHWKKAWRMIFQLLVQPKQNEKVQGYSRKISSR